MITGDISSALHAHAHLPLLPIPGFLSYEPSSLVPYGIWGTKVMGDCPWFMINGMTVPWREEIVAFPMIWLPNVKPMSLAFCPVSHSSWPITLC